MFLLFFKFELGIIRFIYCCLDIKVRVLYLYVLVMLLLCIRVVDICDIFFSVYQLGRSIYVVRLYIFICCVYEICNNVYFYLVVVF